MHSCFETCICDIKSCGAGRFGRSVLLTQVFAVSRTLHPSKGKTGWRKFAISEYSATLFIWAWQPAVCLLS